MMNKVKIKMKRDEVKSLRDIFGQCLSGIRPEDYQQMMTHELMLEVWHQLDRMVHNVDQKKFTLKLTGAQAIAFIVYSEYIPESEIYEWVLVRNIIEMINREHLKSRFV